MESYYIIIYENGGINFDRVKESELDSFKESYGDRVKLILSHKEFMYALGRLI